MSGERYSTTQVDVEQAACPSSKKKASSANRTVACFLEIETSCTLTSQSWLRPSSSADGPHKRVRGKAEHYVDNRDE